MDSISGNLGYYVNTSLPHRVSNHGSEDRVHLVIDAQVNAWVHDVFRRSCAVPTLAPTPQSYEAFRTLLLNDPALQQTLHAIADEKGFIDAVVRMGRERGFSFDQAEVARSHGIPAHAASIPVACPLPLPGSRFVWRMVMRDLVPNGCISPRAATLSPSSLTQSVKRCGLHLRIHFVIRGRWHLAPAWRRPVLSFTCRAVALR